MKKKIRYLVTVALFFTQIFFICLIPAFAQSSAGVKRGVWVPVFTAKRVFYAKKNVEELVNFCEKAKIDEIYLQVYQAGKAYYDTKILERGNFENILKSAGRDTIDLLLERAGKKGIKVFAWLNLLSLGKNEQAEILLRHTDAVLTRDQYGRTSLQIDSRYTELDKRYLREGQLFLEPADPEVRKYLVAVAEEIANRYPLLSGVHLDYARYPYIVPFLPGSRFQQYGLSYGYGKKSLQLFKEKHGYDPLTGLNNEKRFRQWDEWRRQQVTQLVTEISRAVKRKSAMMLVSCAVIPAAERAYTSAFQDWPLWLEEGIADYAALMNYSLDSRLVLENAKAGLSFRGRGRVYVGLGLFLGADNPDLILAQYRDIAGLKPDGIILFSYDYLNDALAAALNP